MGEPIKLGSWGDRMIIIRNHIPYKNISCAACTYYSREDQSCLVTDKIPRIDGWQLWRKCNLFDLDSDYMNYDHMEKVKEVKGQEFFEREREPLAEKLEKQKKNRAEEQRERVLYAIPSEIEENLYFQKVKTILENQMNISFEKAEVDGAINFMGCCLQSYYENETGKKAVIVIAIEKLPIIKHKNKIFTPLAHWFREINSAVFALQKYDSEVKKYLIVPEIILRDEKDTIAELYYKKRGEGLGKIELVELQKTGRLVVPIGPIEKRRILPKESIWKTNDNK